MEIVREYKRPSSSRIMLDIPEKFVDKDLEILIIPVDNGKEETKADKEKLFEQLCGLWSGRDDITAGELRKKAWKRTSS